MRWCLPVAVLLGLSTTDAVSLAQGQGDAQRPAPRGTSLSPDATFSAGYFTTTGIARFQLIQGRLELDPPRHRKGSQSRKQDGVYESVSVTATRGIPSVNYVFQNDRQHLALNVQDATSVRIESCLPETSERAILDQPVGKSINWTLKRGDLSQEFRGPTLLHIRLADPVSFDAHFGSLVAHLLRGYSLAQITSDTNRALCNRVQAKKDTIPHSDIRDCVDRLRSSRASVRRKAERQLLQWGTPIIPIVRGMNPRDLDIQQRSRLASVLNQLRRNDNDTAASLAMMLQNDRSYLTKIVDVMSASDLAAVNRYLSVVGTVPLKISADPITRIADRTH